MDRGGYHRWYPQFFPPPREDPPERRDVGALVALAAVLAVVGYGLLRFWGPPHLPQPLPTPAQVRAALASSEAPYGAIIYAGATLLWALWLWTAGTLLLQLALDGADAVTRGARWVASLRAVADHVTVPLVRRAARKAVVAATVVHLAGRAALPAAAAPQLTAVVAAFAPTTALTAAHAATTAATPNGTVWHRVQPNENLWVLAERYYGDGEEWRRILRANVGHGMADGATFPPTAVIQSGWTIAIPGPTIGAASSSPSQELTYMVRDGDTLRAVARRYLGDERRWPEIYRANRGAHLPDGRTLDDPDLIWPGLRLTIPGVAQPAAPAPSAPTATASKPATTHSSPPRAATSPAQAHPTPHARAVAAPIAAPTPTPAGPTPALGAATTAATTTPISAAATPSPVRPTPKAAPAAVPTVRPASPPSDLPGELLAAGLVGLAGGGAVLLARRLVRTRLDEPPPPPDYRAGVPLRDGYADAAAAPTFARRVAGGPEPAVLVAEQVLALLAAEAGLQDVALVAVHEGRHTMALTLQADLATQARLLAAAPELARRLGARGAATRTPDHDVLLELRDLTRLELAARPRPGPVPPVPLLGVGVSARGEAVHANWAVLGHTLVAGAPGGGAEVVFASMLTALAARCHPDRLALWTVAPAGALPAPLRDLPHQRRGPIDPADHAELDAALSAVRAKLERRLAAPASEAAADRPDLVLAVHELADLPDDGLLDLIGRYGADRGVHLLAATTRPQALPDALLEVFGTRLVLRTADEAQSVRLLGRPDAADLAGAGDLYARLERRGPQRLRGFRVEPDYLAVLVDALRAAFARSAAPDPSAEPPLPLPDAGGDAAPTSPSPPPSVLAAPAPPAAGAAVLAAPSDGAAAVGPSPPGAAACVNGTGVVEPSPLDNGATRGHTNGAVHAAAHVASANGAARAGASSAIVAPGDTAATAPPVTSTPTPAAVPSPAGVRLCVRCFGELAVLGDGRPLAPGPNQRPWELLLYLALRPVVGVSREELLVTFWRDVDPEQAGDRLNSALSRLRGLLARALPGLSADVVRLEREGACHLAPALVWSDAQEFLALREIARRAPPADAIEAIERVRALYRGEVFRQTAYPWLDEPGEDGLSLRESFEEAHAVLTERLARAYAETGRPERAAPLYRELLRREPALQELAPPLYRCYERLGDREGLLRAHQELDAALARLRRRAEAAGDDMGPYRLAAATRAAYERALAALDAAASAGP